MGNELIRKQSVIELIDDLMKSPYANSPQFGAECRECMDLVKELCVHRLTTAYDVDKVVKKLEEKTEIAYKKYMNCPPNAPQSVVAKYLTQYQERESCLKIVKSGITE